MQVIHAVIGERYSLDEYSSSSSSNSSETSSSLVSKDSILHFNSSDVKEDVESIISYSVDESKSNEPLTNKKNRYPYSILNESIVEECNKLLSLHYFFSSKLKI